MKSIRNNRGVALPLAIFALVIIGAMVAGSFFIGTQEQRIGRNTVGSQQAFQAAEYGAQLTAATWNSQVMNAMAVGSTATIGGALSGNQGWYRGEVRRLNNMLFLVRSEGFSADSMSRQQVGLLIRLRPIEITIAAALQTQGDLKIGGSSFISGYDVAPTGWSNCPALESPLPGISMDDSSGIETPGCNDLSCVTGDPKILEDSTISDSSLSTFGDVTFDGLRDLASKIVLGGALKIEPSIVGGACATGSVTNWGSPLDPTGPCGSYFQVVWSEGDLKITGVQGQGVLIVNGDLSVQGNFEFFGPVIIKGTLSTKGTGGHFNGGVIAANVELEQNDVLGNAVINYSSCAILRVLNASASGALLRERSWINLYGQ